MEWEEEEGYSAGLAISDDQQQGWIDNEQMFVWAEEEKRIKIVCESIYRSPRRVVSTDAGVL